MSQSNKNYLIIGTSAAGIAAAKKIRALDAHAHITCLTAEYERPYNKCFLVDWLAQEKTETDMFLNPPDFFETERITCVVGARVVGLDRAQKTVTTDNGGIYNYTTLLIAIGAQPFTLSCPGADGARGVIPFYTMRDIYDLYEFIEQRDVKNIIIIGGGVSGIECADAVKNWGKKITIVERSEHVLARHATPEGADFLRKKIEAYGVDVKERIAVEKLNVDESGYVTSVVCSDGVTFPADCVITALGSRSNIDFAVAAELSATQGALHVNEYLQTNDPAIFAAGDCSVVNNLVTHTIMRNALWSDAVVQGGVAGMNMVALQRTYSGVVPITVSSFFGCKFVSCGRELMGIDRYQEKVTCVDDEYSVVALDKVGIVVGFVCMGSDISYFNLKRSLVLKKPLV